MVTDRCWIIAVPSGVANAKHSKRQIRGSAVRGAGAAPAFGANLVSNGGFEDVTGNTNPSFFLSDTPDAGDLPGGPPSPKNDSNNTLSPSAPDVAPRHDGAEFGFWSTSGVTASH